MTSHLPAGSPWGRPRTADARSEKWEISRPSVPMLDGLWPPQRACSADRVCTGPNRDAPTNRPAGDSAMVTVAAAAGGPEFQRTDERSQD